MFSSSSYLYSISFIFSQHIYIQSDLIHVRSQLNVFSLILLILSQLIYGVFSLVLFTFSQLIYIQSHLIYVQSQFNVFGLILFILSQLIYRVFSLTLITLNQLICIQSDLTFIQSSFKDMFSYILYVFCTPCPSTPVAIQFCTGA